MGFIVVIWIQGTASEVGHSDSCFCRGIEMTLLAIKCRQVFETFQANSQGVPMTGVKYLLPYLIVIGLFLEYFFVFNCELLYYKYDKWAYLHISLSTLGYYFSYVYFSCLFSSFGIRNKYADCFMAHCKPNLEVSIIRAYTDIRTSYF